MAGYGPFSGVLAQVGGLGGMCSGRKSRELAPTLEFLALFMVADTIQSGIDHVNGRGWPSSDNSDTAPMAVTYKLSESVYIYCLTLCRPFRAIPAQYQ